MEANNLARKTGELASNDIGQRETDGPNDSPRIRQYGQTVNITPPSPYCAAAVCTWVKEAAHALNVTHTLKFSARALGLVEHNPDLVIQPQDLTPDQLPVIGVLDHDGVHGHAYIAVGLASNGRLLTVEANTAPSGTREGQGCYCLNIRTVHDQQLKVFIRIA